MISSDTLNDGQTDWRLLVDTSSRLSFGLKIDRLYIKS